MTDVAAAHALRPETEDDLAFLTRLYASTRARDLAMMPWPDDRKDAFVRQQFAAQRHHYRTYYGDTSFDVILREDRPIGRPIGRLYVQRRATRLHIVDISLLPDECGRGLGTAILRALHGQASAGGLALGLSVERSNPALRLYRRLGFREVADTGVYLEMEWPAATVS